MGSQADIQFGRLAQERGWVDPQALRQIYAQLGPGQSLPQALVARGLIAEHHARQLWAEVQQGGAGPVGGQPMVGQPVAGAPVDGGPAGERTIQLDAATAAGLRVDADSLEASSPTIRLGPGEASGSGVGPVPDEVQLGAAAGTVRLQAPQGPAPTLAPPQGAPVEGATIQLGPGSPAGTLAPPTSAAPSWGPGAPGSSSPTLGAPAGYEAGASASGGLPGEGELVGGRFRVGAVLGKGGMGAVYRAHDLSNNAEVALKVMLPGADPDGSATLRFQREAEAVVKVDAHAGIVRVRDFGRHRGMPYAAMDLVVGRDLHEIVKEQGGLPIDEALRLTEAVSRAIAHCHDKGVLHRDLKPANVLRRDEDGQPFVTDFGLALDEQLERLTKTGQVMGTPAYMPPEQAEGDKEAMDERVDVYSLGAILYELVSGEAPFQGDQVMILKQVFMDEPVPLVERRAECSADVDLICQKAMAKDKELRYASAAELAEDIARFRRGDPITARPPTRKEREAWLRKRGDKGAIARYHARWAVPLLLALALGVGLAFAARLLDSEAKARDELALLLDEPLRQALAPELLAERDAKPYTTLLTKLLKDVATLRGAQEGDELPSGLGGLRGELARDPSAEDPLQRPGAGLATEEDLAELHGLARRLAFLDGAPLSAKALAADPCVELWTPLRGLHFGQEDEPSAEELKQHSAALEALSKDGALAPLAKWLSGALRAARSRLERAERAGWEAVNSGQGAWKDADALEEVDALLAERGLPGCFAGVKRALRRAVKQKEASAQLPKLKGVKGVEAFDLLVAQRLLTEPSVEEELLREEATRLFLAQVPQLFDAFQNRDSEPVKRMAARARLLGLVDPDPDAEAFQTYAYTLIGAYQGRETPAEALIQIIRCGVNVVTKQNRKDPGVMYERVRRFLELDARAETKWQWGDAYFVQARLYRLVRERTRDADSDFREKAVKLYKQRPEIRNLKGLALFKAGADYDRELHVEFKRKHDLKFWRKLARLFARALAPEQAFDLAAFGIEPLTPEEHPKLRVSASWRTEVLYWLIEAMHELVHDQLSVLKWELEQAASRGQSRTEADLQEKIRELAVVAKRQRAGVERILPELDTFRSPKKRVDVLSQLASAYLEWRPWLEEPGTAEQRARELYARGWLFALEQLEQLKQTEFREVSFGQLDRVSSQETWIRNVRNLMCEWAKLHPKEQEAAALAEMWQVEERIRKAIKAATPGFLTTLALVAVSWQAHDDARRAIAGVRKVFEEAKKDDERIEWLDEVICYEAMIELEQRNTDRARALYEETKRRVKADKIGRNWFSVLRQIRELEAQSSQGR